MTPALSRDAAGVFVTTFDANQASGVGDWLLPLALLGGGVLVFASPRLRTRLPYGLGILVPVLAVSAAGIAAVAPLLRQRMVAQDLATRHFAVVEGPVTAFTRPARRAAGFVSGSFVVGGQRFSLPNYLITIGFDNQGDAIELGHDVRITHDADMILRVELRR